MTKPRYENDVRDWVAISLLQTGHSTAGARIAKQIFDLTGRISLEEVASHVFRDPLTRQTELTRVDEETDRALHEAERLGFSLMTMPDPRYPALLREIADPPSVLWVAGDLKVLSAPAVAVVGSRNATPMSLAIARRLGKELSEAGLVVISGLALGVDGAAHAGAVAGTGRTVAVLGSGLGVMYPRQHKTLAEAIRKKGALVSELPPWSAPCQHHFPLRNRTISGLSKAIVIVEASERSGSLITARMANDQNRDVLAVPGGILSGRHRGSHALIKDGAKLVETVDDVLGEIGWKRQSRPAAPDSANSLPINVLERVMEAGEPYTIDDLASRLGRPGAEILADLSFLELSGQLARMPGGQFVRLGSEDRGRGK